MVEIIGGNILGFTKYDIGLHSIRSGVAMEMFLSGIDTNTIMKIGHWSSESFLDYISEQGE